MICQMIFDKPLTFPRMEIPDPCVLIATTPGEVTILTPGIYDFRPVQQDVQTKHLLIVKAMGIAIYEKRIGKSNNPTSLIPGTVDVMLISQNNNGTTTVFGAVWFMKNNPSNSG